jgi:hypothetical protein
MKRNMKAAVAVGGVGALAATIAAIGGGTSYASGNPVAGRPGNPGAVCAVPSRYPTIQAAVDAPACTTIRVAPGTYAENVAIARPLTLQGARAGQDARSRRAGGESVISGGTLAPVTITGSNVVVDGFTINGPADSGKAALVLQAGGSGETIQNNIVNNPGRAASIQTSRTTFRGNVVKNTSTATDGFQGNSTPIRDVTITGNTFGGANPAIYNADVTFIEGNANLNVTDNRSTGDGTLVALFKTTGARVAGNTIVGGGGSSAVYVGGGNNNITVTENTISGAGSAVKVANGFEVGTNAGVTISRNTLRNNQYAVNIGPKSPQGVPSLSGVVKANRNSITGNSLYGVFNDPTSGGTADATCNWWGTLTGPGAVASGKGDKVSTGVTYKPWLKLSSLILGCN